MKKNRSPEQQYADLKALLESAPDLLTCDVQDAAVRRWLSRAYIGVAGRAHIRMAKVCFGEGGVLFSSGFHYRLNLNP